LETITISGNRLCEKFMAEQFVGHGVNSVKWSRRPGRMTLRVTGNGLPFDGDGSRRESQKRIAAGDQFDIRRGCAIASNRSTCTQSLAVFA
jgi:hypothetical protein